MYGPDSVLPCEWALEWHMKPYFGDRLRKITGSSGHYSSKMEIEESDQNNGQVQDRYPTGAGSVVREDLERLDTKVIQLLDSVDTYLKLYDSLSRAMRQGWLEIASSRYSMGSSRISEALFSLKPCRAYTSISVEHTDDVNATDESYTDEETDVIISSSGAKQSNCFTLYKWVSLEDKKEFAREMEAGFRGSWERSASELRHRPLSRLSDKAKDEGLINTTSPDTSSDSITSQVRKRKSEALSLFGALVSPQLRFAQVSFETALEILVEIANARSTMLSTLSQISRQEQNGIGHKD